MKFSIITPTFNSGKTIANTIESVINQNNVEIEYIIIDGGSTDGTLEVIKGYQNNYLNIKLISEPDNGIYDAMNKGIKMASGDLVGIINSDDFYKNSDVFLKVQNFFEQNNSDFVYGNLVYVDREDINKVVRYWKAGQFSKQALKFGWAPPHPTVFIKKELYEKFGVFNLKFKVAADYELMLRMLLKDIKVGYVDSDIAVMREGGHSARSLSQRINGWKDLYMSWVVNDRFPPIYMVPVRVLLKVKQYFIKKIK